MVVNNWIAANLIWITLAIAIVVLIYFVVQIIQTVRKKRSFVSQLNIILLILGLMFLIFLTYRANEIEGADWGQIILMIGLVAITAAYASSTTEMAREMKEQRLSEARPYLLMRLDGEAVQWDKDEQGKPPSREFTITIRNVGKGPAINLWAALWGPQKTYFGDNKGYLAPSEEWQTTISRVSTSMVELGIKKEGWLPELEKVITQKYPGIVAVKYNDIHRRTWVSYLCFERHIDLESYVLEEEQNIVELKAND